MDEELVEAIRKALRSDKCNGKGPLDPSTFDDLVRENPFIDLSEEHVPLHVQATTTGLDLPGKISPGIGTLYSLYISYSELPGLVADERVIRVDADQSPEFVTY